MNTIDVNYFIVNKKKINYFTKSLFFNAFFLKKMKKKVYKAEKTVYNILIK